MKAFARVWLAFALVACAPEDILLGTRLVPEAGAPEASEHPEPSGVPEASVPPEPADASDGERQCHNEFECAPSEYCARHKCSDPSGTCELLITVCDADADPVCGCDGITYLNNCLRRRVGVSKASDEACEGNIARKCGGPNNLQCPNAFDFYCSKRVGENSECTPAATGQCWALPNTCDNDGDGNNWRVCGSPAGQCVDACSAIRSNLPYYRGSCTQ